MSDSRRPDPLDGPADRNRPTHLDEEGRARMVDVGEKAATHRRAVATGAIRMARETLQAFAEGRTPKGEAFAVARVAGIQAGKRTDQLIPLCHLLPATAIAVEFEIDEELPGIRVTATAHHHGRTGVEMEALTAASVALLTLYDMAKAIDRGMVIESVRLERKEGGASGTWRV
ncbi:MAG: cyclic pyranopterin monophosphate synthase MoaC [Longimicrobiales bacterium]|nr:cyclic pyranopterin monophosphate synthase MoaC [Longimicrobiales bacterium]